MSNRNNINKYTPDRLNDYIIYCQICGSPCWHSESIRLDDYTGRGGLIVCPRDRDAIDYGLVPYKVPAERSVPEVSINNLADSEDIENLYPPITIIQN